jgi:hypothetical protein
MLETCQGKYTCFQTNKQKHQTSTTNEQIKMNVKLNLNSKKLEVETSAIL